MEEWSKGKMFLKEPFLKELHFKKTFEKDEL